MNSKFFSFAEVLVAVIQSGSITSAAEDLMTTKSNVSKKLSDFEALLGLTLLRRTTRRMEPTPAGEWIYKTCREAVEATTRAALNVGMSADPNARLSGRVAMSGSNTFLTRLVVPLMDRFLQRHPDIEPVFVGSDRPVDLAAENIDLGIRIGPVRTRSMLATSLEPLGRVLCASPDLVASFKRLEHPRQLASFPCILREQEKPVWKLSRGNVSFEHRISNPRIMVNTIEMAHAAAVGGLGLCLLSSLVADQSIRNGRLQRVLPEWNAAPIAVTLLSRNSRLLKPEVAEMHRYIVSELG